jgi:hypothetical protein
MQCGGIPRRKPKSFNISCANPYQYFMHFIKQSFPYKGSNLSYPVYRSFVSSLYQHLNGEPIPLNPFQLSLIDSFYNFDRLHGSRFYKYIHVLPSTPFQDIPPDRIGLNIIPPAPSLIPNPTFNIVPPAPDFVPFTSSYTRPRRQQPIYRPIRPRVYPIPPRHPDLPP